MKRKSGVITAWILACAMVLSLAGCGASNSSTNSSDTSSGDTEQTATAAVTSLEKVDMTAWNYDADNDFYWQTGISYCEKPADSSYETMGFYVPGAFFDAKENGDGTYTCTINDSAQVAGYTAKTAPMVIPVNSPGYAAMSAPTDNSSSCGYGGISDFTSAGFILVFAGARGRDAGAPTGVTDFKAAIRYTRYNSDVLPGDPDRLFSFGMSGGGAQSALIGATGDSALYTPYLNAIGAVEGVSDAVMGSMCWCPVTNLDVADEAYEWNMGSARSGLDTDTQKLSDGLATAFAEYINNVKLKDANGNVLVLEESDDGIWQSGSYYDYIKAVIEESLNNFLSDTEFPYDASSSSGGRGGRGDRGGQGGFGGPNGGNGPGGNFGGPDGEKPDGEKPDGDFGGHDGGGTTDYEAIDGIGRNSTTSGLSLSGTYETAQDYIDALNANGTWVTYDAASNTATITSVADFAAAMKPPSKDVGAFDALDRSQGENTLFGYADGNGAHFDAIEAALLAGTDYESAFAEDLKKQDALGNTVDYRLNMYNPMYYLCDYYGGAGTSKVAKYFRIRTGLSQGDTAVCTEVDLALTAYGCDVDFATVWGAGHTEAERTGSSTENFISWVNSCLK